MSKSTKTSYEAGAEIIRGYLRHAPECPGVYRMLGGTGTVLYVGKAKNIKKRVTSYTQQARLPLRLQRMVAQTQSMELVVTHTEVEALLLEANLVRKLQPRYNILLRDDKSFPYILIAQDHDFPALLKHRGKQQRKGWYFGPFASGQAVTETVVQLQRGFMLRNCSDAIFKARTRPCLQYHIKRCTAPCVAKVSVAHYAAQVAEARDFLSGKNSVIQQNLAEQMQIASDALDYEQAAKLRDRIKVLTTIQSRQDINVAGIGDADIIAAVREEGQDVGQVAIQMFFFRADRNFGTRSYFPQHDADASLAEVLSAFLAQFYVEQPAPPQLLLNVMPEEGALLTEALAQSSAHSVDMHVPQRGEKKRLVDHAVTNASAALQRHMAESATQRQLLQGVAQVFGLSEAPKRIEVYDNSHIQGTHAVGAMIVAGAEGFDKKSYRKFSIRGEAENFTPGDDFAMMREMLGRRLQRLLEEDPDRKTSAWPDLLLIDGGQGQLNSVLQVMVELGIADIAVVGIAKGPDRDAGRERFFMAGREPFMLPHNDPVLYYLQRLRDESHRYVIGAHRQKRTKAIESSPLDGLPGIGAVRKKALLHHFGSAKAVAQAGEADLRLVSGISAQIAARIYSYFHQG
jgi:excinuclease ABC subunit C